MTKCPNCHRELKIVEGTVKFAVQLSDKEDSISINKDSSKIRIKSIEPIEGTPTDYYRKSLEGVNIPTFDDTSSTNKGCGKGFNWRDKHGESFWYHCGDFIDNSNDLILCNDCKSTKKGCGKEIFGKIGIMNYVAICGNDYGIGMDVSQTRIPFKDKKYCNKCKENTKEVINSPLTNNEGIDKVSSAKGDTNIHQQNKELLDKDYGLDARDKLNALQNLGKMPK